MKLNSSELTLRKLILSSMVLENFEYCYFCPLLKEIGSYFGHTDVILTAHKLSKQAQNISDLKKNIQKNINNKPFYIQKKNTIGYYKNSDVLNTKIQNLNYKIILSEYEKHFSLDKYLLLLYLFLQKYCSEFVQPVKKKNRFHLFNQSCFHENIFTCLINLILIYKIWKIKYWYISISQLAFNSKEFRIAQYLLQIARLESKMISMLVDLLKQIFQTNILFILKCSVKQTVRKK